MAGAGVPAALRTMRTGEGAAPRRRPRRHERRRSTDRMKIVVCVKYVPDAQGDRRFADDGTVDRAGTDGILSELDEYAVEEALKIAEADGDSTVTALTVGPDGATDALRKRCRWAPPTPSTSSTTPCTARTRSAPASCSPRPSPSSAPTSCSPAWPATDGGMSVVPAMVAERLGLPQVTFAGSLTSVRRRRRHRADRARRRHQHRGGRGHAACARERDRPDQRARGTPPSRGSWRRRRSRCRPGRSPISRSTRRTWAWPPPGRPWTPSRRARRARQGRS